MYKYSLIRFADTNVQFIDGDRGPNYPNKSELLTNGECVFLNTGNVTTTGFQFDSVDFISAEKDQELRKGKAKRGDIIMTTRGTVGNVAFFHEQIPFDDIRINSGMVIVRVDQKEYLPYFLYVFFRSNLFKKQCLTNGSGSAQPQLPIGALKNISLPKIDTKIQEKIIGVIEAVDKKIDLNKKINTELESMAKLIYDYWFVQFDFPDANGKPYKSSGGKMVYNEALKREIPEGWQVKKIGEVATVKAGGDKPKVFSREKNETCVIPIYSNGIEDEGLYGFTDKAVIINPSITVSARGTIGYSFLRINPFVPIIRLIVLTPNYTKSIKFLEQVIKNLDFEKSGSVQQQLTVPQISNLDILSPPIDILNEYGAITESKIKKIDRLKEENKLLADLRNWLLPMLMNGQVTVKDA